MIMKPKYYYTYNFPNEKVENQYIKDSIDKHIPESKLYNKYGKYRVLEIYDEYEFVRRLKHIQKRTPSFDVTHLVLYNDIFISPLNINKLGCKEDELLNYVKQNIEKYDYIENMRFENFHIVRYEYKYEEKIETKFSCI